MTRYARRVDDNQSIIVSALRQAGAVVKVVHQPFDLQVWASPGSEKCMYMEIKNPGTARGRKGMNEKQLQESKGIPVSMVDSVDSALQHLKVLRST